VNDMDALAGEDAEIRGRLSMKPSEYVARQIRVTPTFTEKVADLIDESGLACCYGFSTDFPHPIGGVHPVETQYSYVARLGDDAIEQYFCTNGQLLL